MKRRRKSFHGSLAGSKPKRFSPRRADGRCDLEYCDLLRILDGIQHFFRVIPLFQSTNRAVGDALSAQGTDGILQRIDVRHIHSGLGSGVDHVPDIHILDLIAHLHAAHAFDTFLIIPDQRKVLIADLFDRKGLLKPVCPDI